MVNSLGKGVCKKGQVFPPSWPFFISIEYILNNVRIIQTVFRITRRISIRSDFYQVLRNLLR